MLRTCIIMEAIILVSVSIFVVSVSMVSVSVSIVSIFVVSVSLVSVSILLVSVLLVSILLVSIFSVNGFLDLSSWYVHCFSSLATHHRTQYILWMRWQRHGECPLKLDRTWKQRSCSKMWNVYYVVYVCCCLLLFWIWVLKACIALSKLVLLLLFGTF